MRKQFIIKEKLKFPSGTATALMISVLHGNEKQSGNTPTRAGYEPILANEIEGSTEGSTSGSSSWEPKMKILIYSFTISGVYVSGKKNIQISMLHEY